MIQKYAYRCKWCGCRLHKLEEDSYHLPARIGGGKSFNGLHGECITDWLLSHNKNNNIVSSASWLPLLFDEIKSLYASQKVKKP